MRRLLLSLPLVFLLAACAPQVDRCTADPTLAECKSAQAVAQSTIAAANADTDARVRQSYMRATQDAVALHAQATQGAINSRATSDAVSARATQAVIVISATAQAVNAMATRTAMEMGALRDSLAMTATAQAEQFKVVSTQTAIEGDAKINAATVQASTASLGQIALFFSAMSIIVALAVYVVIYSRRIGSSLASGVETSASLIRYGRNNERIAYRVLRADGTLEFVPLDQILGHSDRYLDSLNVPPLAKLAALVEADKRTKGVLVSQNTGTFPALVHTDDPAPQLTAAPDGDVEAADWSFIPSFAQCLKLWRPSQSQMMLGYSKAGPVYCGLEDLLSVGIVGRPKTGKSTVLRFIFVQCVMVGAQVVVWDLHRTIVGSLPGANAFTRLADIDASSADIDAELNRRLEAEDYAAQPIMVLADEFPLLAPNSASATATLNRIILEGRKVNLFAMIAGQGLPADLFGGSTPRDALSSRYVLHTTTRAARMAGLEKDEAPWVVDLKRGYAVVAGPVDPQVIGIPNTTAEDVKSVLALAAPSSLPVSAVAPVAAATAVSRSEPVPATAVPASGNDAETDPAMAERREQVRDLLRAQTPVTQIIKQVWGVSTGRAYMKATAEFSQIASELVQ